MAAPLGMAILGLLAPAPLTGYELSRTLGGAISHFWRMRHSQVYPELARLEGAALVVHERLPQQGKPDQKRYSITDAGRERLREWLASPLEATPKRSEIALRAFCVAQGQLPEMADFFQAQAEIHRARLARFEVERDALEALPAGVRDDAHSLVFASHAVLMRGLLFEQASATWCTWLASRLRKAAAAQG
jgi:DNA-binding PadR family transcriptional regulator